MMALWAHSHNITLMNKYSLGRIPLQVVRVKKKKREKGKNPYAANHQWGGLGEIRFLVTVRGSS
jgi:hypothetical protein